MTIMPAFHNWPAEAAIISRLLGYYGELEFMMGICLGHALSDRRKALKVLFRTRGETPRINLADALTKDAAAKDGLASNYADALGGIRQCLSTRNRFSHCHWASLYGKGLFYVDLNKAAAAGEKFEYGWKQASLPWLEEWESYFKFAHDCFLHVEHQMNANRGGPKSIAFPMPAKRQPPPELDPLAQDILGLLPSGP